MNGKLYLITRDDFRRGTQAAQLVHGMASFAREYPETFLEWERTTNTIVCLSVANEKTLIDLLQKAETLSQETESGLAISIFQEPDFNNQITCVVLEPTDAFQNLCKGIPLALSA